SCHDLTNDAQANKFHFNNRYNQEIHHCIHVLSRITENHVVLVDEHSFGNNAIVEGLAQLIVQNNVPDTLPKHLLALNVKAFFAGTSSYAEFEDRLKLLFEKIEISNGNIILYIKEIHLVFGTEISESIMYAEKFLKLMLTRDKWRLIIGTKTLNEYKQYIEKNSEFIKYFERILLQEPTVNDHEK
ncbi:unnamed protein product, partial [Rotaria magnacalcarata]